MKKIFRAKICVPAPLVATTVLTQNKGPGTEAHFWNPPPPSPGAHAIPPPRKAIFGPPCTAVCRSMVLHVTVLASDKSGFSLFWGGGVRAHVPDAPGPSTRAAVTVALTAGTAHREVRGEGGKILNYCCSPGSWQCQSASCHSRTSTKSLCWPTPRQWVMAPTRSGSAPQ